MKRFNIPEKLTPLEAVNCSRYIVSSRADTTFIYDFSNMQHCHPFGLLVLGNAIRRNKNHYKKSKHELFGESGTQGTDFAADLGFFQYAGWKVGRETRIEDYGVRHIPIKAITVKELQNLGLETYVLGDLVDYYAGELAFTLTQEKSSEVKKTLQYCLREMIRNAYEHAGVEKVWVCGQYWPSRNEAEIALIDEGKGIWGSLRTNRRYKLFSDLEANKLALQPGASRMLGLQQDPYDIWQNSGYGLFMASALCGIGGYFILGSGKDTTLVNSEQQINYDSDINGTAVCMNIKTDLIDNLQMQLDHLAKVGRERAEENSQLRILSASKVSTIASLLRDISD